MGWDGEGKGDVEGVGKMREGREGREKREGEGRAASYLYDFYSTLKTKTSIKV